MDRRPTSFPATVTSTIRPRANTSSSVWGISETDLPRAGKSAYELLDSAGEPGGIQALIVMGSNPVVSAPNATHVVDRLKQLDFLLVSDFFLSETAELADVVLPSAQWAEEEGTVTNLEGRVIRRRRAIDPPAGVKNDIDLLCLLADRLGKGSHFSFAGAREVFDELRRATAGGAADYSGITYERIDAEDGVFWPCAGRRRRHAPAVRRHLSNDQRAGALSCRRASAFRR